ncbi:MAG: AAA family ATPase [Candidatus Sumerlaeota bacterium]|nr:AAA family ATPase [Candidatus Sumerlaeota bacterium]
MYLKSAVITDIRSIEKFELSFNPDEYAGWHVLLGDNGSGKTTVARAIALALVGPLEAPALRENWDEWIRKGSSGGSVELRIIADKDRDHYGNTIPPIKRRSATQNSAHDDGKKQRSNKAADQEGAFRVALTITRGKGTDEPASLKGNDKEKPRSLWGYRPGWFSASYGPFRRFGGGDKEYDKMYESNRKLASHLTVFGEQAALSESISWLHTGKLEKSNGDFSGVGASPAQISKYMKILINDGGMLPNNTTLKKITSESVIFEDGNGCQIPAEQLSDGYRSVLSMTFELIRQMIYAYKKPDILFSGIAKKKGINLPGVVLIDEIDAHLHPTWQKRIGQWFRRYFPKIQFIVTTHSPIICQSAECGSIWRLPAPGGEEKPRRITGLELDRLVYGSILEAYGTDLFGADVTRSDSSTKMLDRLAQINVKSINKRLSAREMLERKHLLSVFPTAMDAGLRREGVKK